MAKPPGRERCSWEAGLGVGPRCGKIGEIAIGARSGIFKARTVRRRSIEDRWKPEGVELTGEPWRMSEDDDEADGEPSAKLQVLEEAIRKHDADVERIEIAHQSVPRSFFITKKDMEQHGCSAKCPPGTRFEKKSQGYREGSRSFPRSASSDAGQNRCLFSLWVRVVLLVCLSQIEGIDGAKLGWTTFFFGHLYCQFVAVTCTVSLLTLPDFDVLRAADHEEWSPVCGSTL